MNISEWVLLLVVGEQRGRGERRKEGRKEGEMSKGAGGRERLLVVGSVRSSEGGFRTSGENGPALAVQRVTAIPGDYDDDGQGDG